MSQSKPTFHFHERQSPFHIALDLSASSASSPVCDILKIRLESTLTYEVYYEIIDQKYVNSRQELNCFAGPSDIYDYISQNFSTVILETGVIRFLYKWGVTVEREREVVITLRKEGKTTLQQAHTRIDLLHEEFHCLRHIKLPPSGDCNNQELQKEIDALEDNLDKTNNDVKELRKDLGDTNEEIRKTNFHLSQTNERLTVAEEDIKKTSDSLKQTNTHLAQTESKIEDTNKKVGQLQSQLASTQSDLSQLSNKVKQQDDRLDATESNINKIEGNIGAIQSDIQATNQRLDETNAKVEQANREIGEVKTELAETKLSLEENKNLITETNQKLDQTRNQLNTTKSELEKAQNDIKATSEALQSTNTALQANQKQIVDTNLELARVEHELQQTRIVYDEKLAQKDQEIKSLDQQLQELLVRFEKLESQTCPQQYHVYHHPQNGHMVNYSLYITGTHSARIVRHGRNQVWYNFVNKNEIKENLRYKIKLNKTSKKLMLIGFCTALGFGANTYERPETAYYNCIGQFWVGPEGDEIPTVSSTSDFVECEADLSSQKFRWFQNGTSFKEIDIPTDMKDKPYFLSISMYNDADDVSISVVQ